MELIYIFAGILLVLCVVYLTGCILLLPHSYLIKESRPYSILAYKLFFGVTGCITIYSLIGTCLLSVNLIILIAYLSATGYSLAAKKIIWNINPGFYFSDIKKLPFFIPVLLIAICIGLFRFHYFTSGSYIFSHTDNTYYLLVARFMPVTHMESTLPWNALITGSNSALIQDPYHYGNLWLTSACVKLCPFLLPMVTYYYVLTPVLILLLSIVLASLIHSLSPAGIRFNLKFFGIDFANNNVLNECSIIILGFLFAMYWGYTPKIPLGFIHTVSVEHKNFNFVFPMAFAVLCYIQGNKPLAYFAFSSVFILDFVYYPVIGIGTGILVLFFISGKNRLHLQYLVIVLYFGVFVLLFYYFFGSSFSVDMRNKGADLFSFLYFANSLYLFSKSLLIHIATCFPFYIALWFIIRRRYDTDDKILHIVFFLSGMIILSMLFIGFGHFHPMPEQFARAINPCTSIGLLLLLTSAYGNSKIIPRKILFILLFFVAGQSILAILSQSTQKITIKGGTGYPAIAKTTLDSLSQFLKGNEKVIGFFANGPNHSLGVAYFDYNFSGFLKQDIAFIEINLPESAAADLEDQQFINLKMSPFYEYMQELKQNNAYHGPEDARVKFLKEQNINFVLLSAGNTPNSIMNFVIDSIVFDAGKPLKLYKLKL